MTVLIPLLGLSAVVGLFVWLGYRTAGPIDEQTIEVVITVDTSEYQEALARLAPEDLASRWTAAVKRFNEVVGVTLTQAFDNLRRFAGQVELARLEAVPCTCTSPAGAPIKIVALIRPDPSVGFAGPRRYHQHTCEVWLHWESLNEATKNLVCEVAT